MIRLSIALVTRNRPESLARCLDSVRAQDAQPFEVVISDDSDNAGAAATQRIAEHYGCRYHPGPRRGLYANRNHAARACQGTHVRTMDDDHTLPEGHLAQCLTALRTAPRSLWTTGETSFITGRHCATAFTANQLHPSGVGCSVGNIEDNWAVADGSTIYPREIFVRGLCFVEDYPYGSSYLEFGALLYRCGWHSRCVPDALVEHHATEETLNRGKDRRLIPAQLEACLSYNLCFQPHWLRALRYAVSCLRRDPGNVRLLRRVPRLIAKVRERWQTAQQIAQMSAEVIPVDFRQHLREDSLPAVPDDTRDVVGL